mmetsp:Transcript_48757/g.155896  ORF Transcript_48757/g.155896 Transcript_48757/m.155896 type:complete len:422 (+) Transcript_48757:78-1343(+)
MVPCHQEILRQAGVPPRRCHKTKMCRFYGMGLCVKGVACTFAHGAVELQLKQPSGQPTALQPALPVLLASGRRELLLGQVCLLAPASKAACVAKGLAPEVFLGRQALPACLPEPKAGCGAEGACGTPAGPPAAADSASGDSLPHLHTAELRGQMCAAPCLQPHAKARSPIREGEGQVPRNKFHKTKMCMFFMAGRCKKRTTCNFAHSEDELQPLPDLHCTKLCPTLLSGGKCKDTKCLFAHNKDELRVYRPNTPSAESDSGLSDPGFDEDDCEPDGANLFRRLETEDPALFTMRQLRVKNTFLTVESEEPKSAPQRSKSAPALLGPAPEAVTTSAPAQRVARTTRTLPEAVLRATLLGGAVARPSTPPARARAAHTQRLPALPRLAGRSSAEAHQSRLLAAGPRPYGRSAARGHGSAAMPQ